MIVDHDKQDEERAEATLNVLYELLSGHAIPSFGATQNLVAEEVRHEFQRQKFFLMGVFRAARGQP